MGRARTLFLFVVGSGLCALWQASIRVDLNVPEAPQEDTHHHGSAEALILPNVHTYSVCNGFANQLLSHAGNIAYALASNRNVLIPDAYIMNGVQTSISGGRLLDVTPGVAAHAELSSIWDVTHLLDVIASMGIKGKLVPYTAETHDHLTCSWIRHMRRSDARIVRRVLDAFVPNEQLRRVVGDITGHLPSQTTCVHHRDGADWHAHCAAWAAIADGLWRGNCLLEEGRTLLDAVWNRMTLIPKVMKSSLPSLYFVGDHAPPPSLTEVFQVTTRAELLCLVAGGQPMRQGAADDSVDLLSPLSAATCPSGFREVCAMVDFFVCGTMANFVGNSVSTWSALQIAKRDTMATWYNSRSVPLSQIWSGYLIPIVYTYTEWSHPAGKFKLMASVMSVRRHVPDSRIHILYHGTADKAFRLAFRSWLLRQGVAVFQHTPHGWKEIVRDMFESGDSERSHLFQEWGSYVGTWQRIDIPLYLGGEYALYLDCDTIVMAPFTLADSGAEMTRSISLSTEIDAKDGPLNAGVALLNIPYLRETHSDFIEFIRRHRHNSIFQFKRNGLTLSAPSDQGALLAFYNSSVKLLETKFNTKSYSPSSTDVRIFHFHGAKPHDFFGHVIGKPCHQAFQFMCDKFRSMPLICTSLKIFAEHLQEAEAIHQYCQAARRLVMRWLFHSRCHDTE